MSRNTDVERQLAGRLVLHDDCAAVNLFPGRGSGKGGTAGSGPLRVCIVVRGKGREAELVALAGRGGFDSRVLLGCEVDAGGRIHRWLEVHIQCLEGVRGAPPAFREGISNAVLDARWRAQAEAAEACLPPKMVIVTGFEGEHPLPLFIDPERMEAVLLGEEARNANGTGGSEGRPEGRSDSWRLCRDEALLASRGLPPYVGSLHRYLYRTESQEESRFIPVTPGAPENEHTLPLANLTGDRLLAVNPSCGLLMVREHCTAGFEEFSEMLSAEPAKATLNLDPLPDGRRAEYQPLLNGGMLLARQGQGVRLVEVLHLKLRLLADAVEGVRAAVLHTQSPLLNVSAGSFRVEIGPFGVSLPALWTARAQLVQPGEALPLRIAGADAEYFVSPRRGASIYVPESAGRAVEGRGQLRMRKVTAVEGRPGVGVVSGTFLTQERINLKGSDLLWVKVQVGSSPVDLYASLDEGAAGGEWRFTTVPQEFGEEGLEQLARAEGVSISDAPFQTIPLLSTPCDLHALGVLCVRTLLVCGGNTLAEAMDELLSLARAAADQGEGSLADRVARVLPGEAQWLEALGPQRLAEGVDCGTAIDLVPMEVWCNTLATVIRMFPGVSDESICRDLGDAPAAGLQSVFDPASTELERLVMRVRSLIVIDWRQNREIHSVVRRHRLGLGAAGAEMQRGEAAQRKGVRA